MSESDWSLPKAVDDVFLAFPAQVIGTLIPPWNDIPDEFKNFSSGHEELASYACFHPVEFRQEALTDGVSAKLATRHLSAVARSFEPKHEHKEAAIAFLISLWLKKGEA
jgi:hypothetical protein